MALMTTGTARAAIPIAMLLAMAILSARQPDGQQMVWTMSMFDGCGRMVSATTEATVNRSHVCARAWATSLVWSWVASQFLS